MKYTVVIRTKNSGRTIQNCLESVLNQSIAPSEIIVVDSGSKDETLKILQGYPIKLIHYPKDIEFNYSKALNIGIKQATSVFILILSSHVQLFNSYLVDWMYSLLINTTKCIAVSTLRSDQKNAYIENFDLIKKVKITIENFEGRAIYNFCSFIKKSSWEKYMFNEKIPSCEDQEWGLHFLKQSFCTVVIEKPKVYYNNPYYNLKKDVQDIIVLGEYIYPQFLSNNYVKKLIKKSIAHYKKNQFKTGWQNMYIGICILRHKYLKKIKFKSVYSNRLK